MPYLLNVYESCYDGEHTANLNQRVSQTVGGFLPVEACVVPVGTMETCSWGKVTKDSSSAESQEPDPKVHGVLSSSDVPSTSGE